MIVRGQNVVMCDRDRQDLQEMINKLLDWASTWGMSFNKSKCKVMHVGTNNPKYEMQDTKLVEVKEEKDVGVTIHKSMKPARQCQKAATTGLGELHKLRKNFNFQDRHVFVKLYKQYVRPHLEFAPPVWSP
jgi:ribonucleases P/MRP protein subunit RPP40